MTTIHCKVLALEHDILDYHTIVVENLDDASFGQHYIMCTIWPNWQSRIPEIGESGFLLYKVVQAGVDTWFDGNNFIPYNYTNVVFIKFIKEEDNYPKDILL